MDIQRPSFARQRKTRRYLIACCSLLLLLFVATGLSRLKPAAPKVDKSVIFTDIVKRGPLTREVYGNGTLVPEQIQLVQAETDGRVERIHVLPGAVVQADTILVELSNPELKQSTFEVEWQIKGAEAQLQKLKVQLESDRLTQEASTATLKTESILADVDAEADTELSKSGLIPALTLKKSKARADELRSRYQIEVRRLKIAEEAAKAQIAVQDAEIAKLRALYALRERQVQALQVKAGIEGVLQQIGDREVLQAGQRVAPGATLAKVVQPAKLKAEIKVPETRAKDILLGQIAKVDTRNGIVPGKVQRIDPAAQNGTVTVDITLTGPLPKGARPDMNIEGTIELEHMPNVLFVTRPYQIREENVCTVFKVIEGGSEALRTTAKFGRSSVSNIEIVSGLTEGDRIIVSDMAQWDAFDRVRIR